jgi:hypothetical protein
MGNKDLGSMPKYSGIPDYASNPLKKMITSTSFLWSGYPGTLKPFDTLLQG